MKSIIQNLKWDSDFFGFPVVLIDCAGIDNKIISQAILKCRNLKIKLIYLFINPNDEENIKTIQSLGAYLVDRKVTFSMPLKNFVNDELLNCSIISTNKFTSKLESLAWQSGEYSRFRVDAQFPKRIFERLYSQWLRNSLDRKIAHEVLVFRQNTGEEVGMITLGEKNGCADIGLLAVDKTVRGRQIGQSLVAEVQKRAIDRGYTELQVVTQGDNLTAFNFYQKCGFGLIKESHIYHLWLE